MVRNGRPVFAGVSFTLEPIMQLTGAVLMGTGVTTHWVYAGIDRRLVLPFQQNGGTVTATLPMDANVAPLGYYMLFAGRA